MVTGTFVILVVELSFRVKERRLRNEKDKNENKK